MRNCDRIARRAFDLLNAGWCQGACARDAFGDECASFADAARSFDLLGACERAAELTIAEPGERQRALGQVFDAVVDELARRHAGGVDRYGGNNDRAKVNMAEWNDAPGRTHRDALAVMRAAIESLAAKVSARG